MIKRFSYAAMAFAISLLCVPAHVKAFTEAGEAYVAPDFEELTEDTVILGGMDVNDPNVLDEYIRMKYCDLYKENYKDDFAWHQLEKQIISKINTKKEYYRTQYQIVGEIDLGQYDFTGQQFPLVDDTAFMNVGTMVLLSPDEFKPYCKIEGGGRTGDHVFPRRVDIALSQPFTMVNYKIPPDEAQQMLEKMRKLKINGRKLYVRFRFHVQAVSNVQYDKEHAEGAKTLLGGEIVAVDLFYDRDMTQWQGRLLLR